MALLPAVMSLFGGRSNAGNPADPGVAAAQTTAAVANPSVPSPGTPASTGSVAAIPAAATGDKSPLDNFNDLWKTDPNNPATPAPTLTPPWQLDPKGLMDAATKVDFTAHIPGEQFTKALSGDVAALRDIVNKAAQYGFANSAAASGEMVKNSMSTAQSTLENQILPNSIRREQVSSALAAENPIFTDPAVAPMMNMLKDQFMMKYPQATPKQIADHAAQYLSGMSSKIVTAAGGQVVSKQQQTDQRGGFAQQADQDWAGYFGLPG